MNTLITIASLLAVASSTSGYAGQGYSGAGSYYGAYATPYGGHYSGANAVQHTGPPGSDTLEVTLAKQAHFAAHAEANARNQAVGYTRHSAPLGHAHASPIAYAHASPISYAHASPIAYGAHALPVAYGTTRLVDPVAIAHGAPLPTGDTVEVHAAKVAHAHAHAAVSAGHAYGRYKRGLVAAPLAHSGYAHGSHAVAYNAPLVSAPHPVAHHGAYAGHASPLAYAGHAYAGAYPLGHAVGPVTDTVEVAVAKQAHFAAHAEVNARNHAVGYAGQAAPLAYAHASPLAYAHASPISYAHASPIAYGAHALPAAYGTTRLVDPVAIAHGAPLPTGDTVEVAAAKVAHFHAHAAAKSGHAYNAGAYAHY